MGIPAGDSGTDKWIHKMYKVNTAALGCRVKFYETKDIDAAYAWVSKKSKKEKKKEITKEDLLGTRKHEDRKCFFFFFFSFLLFLSCIVTAPLTTGDYDDLT